MGTKNGRWIGLLVVSILLISSYASATKIASWNLLQYSVATGVARHPFYQNVIKGLNPDILIVQEMGGRADMYQFLNKVMNIAYPGKYAAGPFIDGPDSDNAIFYNKSQFTFISHRTIKTPFRDISEYVMRYRIGYGFGVTFRIYSVNLKEGATAADRAQRAIEAAILRENLNQLPPKSLFLICGSLNVYSSSERAFMELTESQNDNDGRAVDPTKKTGIWHDNAIFAKFHTQSTRMISFGGGDSGGMADRSDFILVSNTLDNGFWRITVSGKDGQPSDMTNSFSADSKTISTSMGFRPIGIMNHKVYGNDGNHFKNAINALPNTVVSPVIANSLYRASDHLPVVVEAMQPLD